MGAAPEHPTHALAIALLQTKRAPVLQGIKSGRNVGAEEHTMQEAVGSQGTAEHAPASATAAETDAAARFPCASMGDPEQTAWLCHQCAGHLCRLDIKMQPQAMANWNWGGRLHPLYKDLTMAIRMLLGLGRAVMLLVLLKPRGKTDEVGSLGAVGTSTDPVDAAAFRRRAGLLFQCRLHYRPRRGLEEDSTHGEPGAVFAVCSHSC
jgi:hypothetical protein